MVQIAEPAALAAAGAEEEARGESMPDVKLHRTLKFSGEEVEREVLPTDVLN